MYMMSLITATSAMLVCLGICVLFFVSGRASPKLALNLSIVHLFLSAVSVILLGISLGEEFPEGKNLAVFMSSVVLCGLAASILLIAHRYIVRQKRLKSDEGTTTTETEERGGGGGITLTTRSRTPSNFMSTTSPTTGRSRATTPSPGTKCPKIRRSLPKVPVSSDMDDIGQLHKHVPMEDGYEEFNPEQAPARKAQSNERVKSKTGKAKRTRRHDPGSDSSEYEKVETEEIGEVRDFSRRSSKTSRTGTCLLSDTHRLSDTQPLSDDGCKPNKRNSKETLGKTKSHVYVNHHKNTAHGRKRREHHPHDDYPSARPIVSTDFVGLKPAARKSKEKEEAQKTAMMF